MATLKSFVWDDERKVLTARTHEDMQNFNIPFADIEKDNVASSVKNLTDFISAGIEKIKADAIKAEQDRIDQLKLTEEKEKAEAAERKKPKSKTDEDNPEQTHND
jgi:hypothetical protein